MLKFALMAGIALSEGVIENGEKCDKIGDCVAKSECATPDFSTYDVAGLTSDDLEKVLKPIRTLAGF